MTQVIKDSSKYLETKIDSLNTEIQEIKDKIESNKILLDKTRNEKYSIDMQLEQAKKRSNSITMVWVLAFIAISVLSIFLHSINILIPIAISAVVILPIAVYYSRNVFNDLDVYNKLKSTYEEKGKIIADYDSTIRKHNDDLNFLSKRYDDHSKGLIGEKKVTEILKDLGNDNYLINDITLDRAFGNIDHILISKHGIFIIETKNWEGQIICDGDNWNKRYENDYRQFDLDIQSISKRIKGNARFLRLLIEDRIFHNLMNIWVEGIIVFTNENAKIKVNNPTMPVLTIEELNDHITKQPLTEFTSRDLESIANLIYREAKDKHD